jgi:hypothetical protein
MSDDKSKRGRQDKAKVAGREAYEVSYVARKFGTSVKVVRSVISLIGNGRNKVYKELRRRLGIRGRSKPKGRKRRAR